VQPSDLVAAGDVDLVVHDLQTQGLKQPRRVAAPLQLLELLVDSADDPDVAADGADGAVAVLEKVVPAETKEALPGVVVRGGEGVDDVGGVVRLLAQFTLGDDGIGISGGSPTGSSTQLRGQGRLLDLRDEALHVGLRRARRRHEELTADRLLVRWEGDGNAAGEHVEPCDG
jgi:hypothetical protein